MLAHISRLVAGVHHEHGRNYYLVVRLSTLLMHMTSCPRAAAPKKQAMLLRPKEGFRSCKLSESLSPHQASPVMRQKDRFVRAL